MSTLAVLALLLVFSVFPGTCRAGSEAMPLTQAEQRLLFQLARDSITARFKGQAPELPADLPPALQERRGVFVTLQCRGRLRGCIGYLEAVKPLAQAVQEMAAAAAFHDPRFPPVRAEEVPGLDLEISILTPMRQVQKVEEIEVGRHGLYIERGSARGLLLPQVATDCRWDRTTFLEQTCLKAGLPPHTWKEPGTKIYVFSAEILHEPPATRPPQEPQTP